MNILGIETSCDETGVAIMGKNRSIVTQALHSQIEMHRLHGGIVPELASRDHVKKLLPLVQHVLDAGNLALADIDAIAFTAGPGLIGALLVGATFARSLAYSQGIPVIPIHHMEAHLLVARLEYPQLQFPFCSLLVSGGHTLLIRAKGVGDYEILGQTVDDAAGEAFDKTARLMGLPYPGGPEIAKKAVGGDASAFHLPRPMTNKPGLDFSFSGLKTAVRLAWEGAEHTEQTRADLSAATQDAIVDTIVIKVERALKATQLTQLVVAGGVASNRQLRQQLAKLGDRMSVEVLFPSPEYCTDNGAMVAYAGFEHLSAKSAAVNHPMDVRPRWPLTQLYTT